MDSQLVELVNTHRVIESILRAGLDVARPVRDDGIDLICYRRKGKGSWISVPLQIKSRFDVQKKYLARPGLVMCYVCPDDVIFVLTHERAVEIAQARGYLGEVNSSWKGKDGYSCAVGKSLARVLRPHIATTDLWHVLVDEHRGTAPLS